MNVRTHIAPEMEQTQTRDSRWKATPEELERLRAAGPPKSRAYWREAQRQCRARKRAAQST